MNYNMESNNIYDILNRHKRDITCDLCRKRIWFLQKAARFVIRTKDNVWIEYYHIKCLNKITYNKEQEKLRAGKWDDKDDTPNTSLIH